MGCSDSRVSRLWVASDSLVISISEHGTSYKKALGKVSYQAHQAVFQPGVKIHDLIHLGQSLVCSDRYGPRFTALSLYDLIVSRG